MTLAEKYDVEYDGWGTTTKILTGKTKKAMTTKISLMKTTTAFATR
ncbi:ribonuclease E inhibitor RraB [Klebsiella grimontii]|uniref:Ribonuclease E inhibitor RraB n=1 Tax=Klebsiella grimontii TaxID=2058152 RepID=A0A7H4PBA6_9ENTR|nr:ribonuclease E inhibitor RraB [Klebsiella grimontii]